MRDIGKNIRQLREKAGLTQEAFAEKLFVTRQTVSNYENGRTRPDLDMLLAIAEVLQADVTHILYGVPTPADRKRSIRQLVAGGIVSILLIAALAILLPLARNYVTRSFIVTPMILLRMIVAPWAFLTLGWTLMQLAIVLGVTPLRKDWCKIVKWFLLAILFLYALLVVPYLIWSTWCGVQILIHGEVESYFSVSPIYDKMLCLALRAFTDSVVALFVCVPYGAALRYFCFRGSGEPPVPERS